MNYFDEYYKNIIFYKLKEIPDYFIYGAKIESYINNGERYIMLIVPNSFSFLDKGKITDLSWVSLQTRTIEESYKISTQFFQPKDLDPNLLLTVKNKNYNKTEYFSPLPIEISLLHNIKRKSIEQYPDQMTLHRALNSYQCVIKKL